MRTMSLQRNNKTVSVKIAGEPEPIMALVRVIDSALPGVVITTGVKPSDHKGTKGRFDYPYFCFLLVSFELVGSGSGEPIARPTQRNAILAFKEGRTP